MSERCPMDKKDSFRKRELVQKIQLYETLQQILEKQTSALFKKGMIGHKTGEVRRGHTMESLTLNACML